MMKKLQRMPYAQARVEITDGKITLYSYITPVAEIRDNWLIIRGLYSATTRRHIGAFMQEYVTYPNGEHGTYQDAKKLFTSGKIINLETGELR